MKKGWHVFSVHTGFGIISWYFYIRFFIRDSDVLIISSQKNRNHKKKNPQKIVYSDSSAPN